MNKNANQSPSDLLLSLEGEIFCFIEIRSHSQSQLLKSHLPLGPVGMLLKPLDMGS